MCWVALDRAAKLAGIRGMPELESEWRETADEIRADILEHGLRQDGVLRQHYDTDALDASTLLAAVFGFLPADDERLRASVLAIAEELTEHGFVLRYRTDETDDGLQRQGRDLPDLLVLAGVGPGDRRGAAAGAATSWSGCCASPRRWGCYAEEFDTDTGHHLGNFPQAFSHLALIEAAGRIILDERMEELQG